MEFALIWGGRIRRLRENHGWTQAELAARCGVTSPAVTQWEVGSRTPRPAMWPLLASVLDITVDELISTTPDPESAVA